MSFGFETPLWLGALGALLPIAWLYLQRRRRPPATVSSLVIWQSIAQPVTRKRDPRLPLLFVVQALLLLAAAIAAAGPYLLRPKPPGPPRDAIVVLDVSASMQANLGSGDGSRFDAARDAALARARSLAAAGKRITVIAAGVQPSVVGAGLDGEQAERAIGALLPLDTAGNLTAAAELAATRAGAEGSVDLFTDTPVDDLVMSRDARRGVAVHRFGTGGANVAITAIRVQTSPFQERSSSRVLVTVRSFSSEPRQVSLTLAPLEPGAGSSLAPLEPATGASLERSVSLGPDGTEIVAFDVIPWSGPFSVRTTSADDLALDDVGYGFLPPKHEQEVVLVSDDEALSRAFDTLARKLGTFQARTIAPADYRPETRAGITIFDRVAPPIPPAGNVAYLAPRQGNSDVTVTSRPSEARLAETREHDILRGVQNPEVLVSGPGVTLASSELRPVLLGRAEGREIPLALAGTIGDRRIVATAFPLRAGSLSDADRLPTILFTLNMLRWLSPATTGAPIERLAGERLRAGSAGAPAIARLIGPDGDTQNLGPTEEVSLTRAGVYEAVASDGTRRLLVSFVDPNESNIRRAAASDDTPPVPTAPEPAAGKDPSAAKERIPYARAALLALLALMVVEALVATATGKSSAEASGGREPAPPAARSA